MSHRTVRPTLRHALRHIVRHAVAGAALIGALALAGPARAQDRDIAEASTTRAEVSFLELALDWLTGWIAPDFPTTEVQADTADAGWIIDPDG